MNSEILINSCWFNPQSEPLMLSINQEGIRPNHGFEPTQACCMIKEKLRDHICTSASRTGSESSPGQGLWRLSPTNSGVPKMFLNSTPASILWAKPKSINLILGSGTFLSSSIMFSGCKKSTHRCHCLVFSFSFRNRSSNSLKVTTLSKVRISLCLLLSIRWSKHKENWINKSTNLYLRQYFI